MINKGGDHYDSIEREISLKRQIIINMNNHNDFNSTNDSIDIGLVDEKIADQTLIELSLNYLCSLYTWLYYFLKLFFWFGLVLVFGIVIGYRATKIMYVVS